MTHLTPKTNLPPFAFSMTENILKQTLKDDLGMAGDLTSNLILPRNTKAVFTLKSRQNGRLAGINEALNTFKILDPDMKTTIFCPDGIDIVENQELAEITGSAHTLLAAERTALNIISHLSGIASYTYQFVQKTQTSMARITATRKTLPGLHMLQRRAVILGGGFDHRHTLSDAVLIKDNHIAIIGSVSKALEHVRNKIGHMVKISVEVDSLALFEEALSHEPDVILLDNMNIKDMREAVRLCANRLILEASGNVTLENVREIAETGVDIISVGALTHSARCLDIGFDFKSVVN